MLQIRTSNTKTRGAARQVHLRLSSTKTSICFHSGSHWARTQADLCSHQYSCSHGLKHRSWEVTGRRSPAEPSPFEVLFLFNTNHKTAYKMNSPTSSWYSCPQASSSDFQEFLLPSQASPYMEEFMSNIKAVVPKPHFIPLLLPSVLTSLLFLFQAPFAPQFGHALKSIPRTSWLFTRASNPPCWSPPQRHPSNSPHYSVFSLGSMISMDYGTEETKDHNLSYYSTE